MRTRKHERKPSPTLSAELFLYDDVAIRRFRGGDFDSISVGGYPAEFKLFIAANGIESCRRLITHLEFSIARFEKKAGAA